MQIKIHTLSTCHHCIEAKEFLKKHKIVFDEIQVDGNKKLIEEVYKKSKQYGVPVIEIKRNHNVAIVAGFDEGKLKQILNLK